MDKIVLKKTEKPNEIKVWHPFNDQLFWKMKSIENAVWNKKNVNGHPPSLPQGRK